jgi:hypothetical protein
MLKPLYHNKQELVAYDFEYITDLEKNNLLTIPFK